MAAILFGQNDRKLGFSTNNTVRRIESILKTRHSLLQVPAYDASSEAGIQTWISQNGLGADLYVGSDYRVLRRLRELGWKGRVLWIAHGDLPHGASGLRSGLPFLWMTDAIWVASYADKRTYESLVAQNGSQPKIALLPYGVDCNAYSPLTETDRRSLRQEWGIVPEEFVVVYTGRISAAKNVQSAVEALYYLSLLGPKVKFLVAGTFDNRAFREFHFWATDPSTKIQRLIEHFGLADRVKFVGWVDQGRLNELYNVGDVFINLTLDVGENFGNTQVEAMSAGLPVVGTAWGGLKDTIVEGQTGFLADTWISEYGVRFDMPKVINVLRLLMDQPTFRNKIGTYASQRAREQYSLDMYSDRLLELIDTLVSTTSRESRARFTNFGSSLHSRFTIIDDYTGDRLAGAPIFPRLSDPHWTELIAPYTSLGWIEPSSGNHLFTALMGRTESEYYYSTDLLWPVRIRTDAEDAKVIQQLSRYPGLNRGSLDCSDDVICKLVRKGLVGISRWDPPDC